MILRHVPQALHAAAAPGVADLFPILS